jgi:hypothetical protein
MWFWLEKRKVRRRQKATAKKKLLDLVPPLRPSALRKRSEPKPPPK